MRTRDAKLSDYDVPKEDEARLDEYCKKLDSDIRFILFSCAISKAPGMELVIYESLTAKDPKEAGTIACFAAGVIFRLRPMIFTATAGRSKQSFTTG